MSEFFLIIASLAMVGVAIAYLYQTIKGTSTPNPSTWLIWLIVMWMNVVSYSSVVGKDLLEYAVSLIIAIGITIICAYALFRGKFTKPGLVEIICFVMSMGVGVIWYMSNALVANLLMQAILLISFAPTVTRLLNHEAREKPLPWNLAIISYTFLIVGLAMGSDKGNWTVYVHPIVNGILGNGSICLIANLQKYKKK